MWAVYLDDAEAYPQLLTCETADGTTRQAIFVGDERQCMEFAYEVAAQTRKIPTVYSNITRVLAPSVPREKTA
jgi:hypothetical protein